MNNEIESRIERIEKNLENVSKSLYHLTGLVFGINTIKSDDQSEKETEEKINAKEINEKIHIAKWLKIYKPNEYWSKPSRHRLAYYCVKIAHEEKITINKIIDPEDGFTNTYPASVIQKAYNFLKKRNKSIDEKRTLWYNKP